MDTYFLLRHIVFAIVIVGISALATRLVLRHLIIYDVPNERSSHTRITPKGGGIAIVAAFLAGIALIQLIGDKTPIYTPYFLGFFASSFVIAALSFYDDLRHVPFTIKLGGHVLAIIVAMCAGIVIDMTHLPFFGEVRWGWGAYPLTLLWVLGLTNSYNFMDGLDGLAASTAVIAALFLSIISFQQGSHFIYLASLVLAAASLGFLLFNRSPAKIFMGDIGSTFLGFTFATMAVIAARYDHSHTSFFVVPLLLFHFIFDTLFTFFRRLLAGEHVFMAHRSHLYQLLNRLDYSHRQVVLFYSAMAISQGFAAVWMTNNLGPDRMIMYLPFLIFNLMYAAWVLVKAKKRGIIL